MRRARALWALGLCVAVLPFVLLVDQVPRAVVTHGVSMQPRFSPGDLVVVRPATSYAVGDVTAYDSPMLNTVVLHRIVAIEGDRYVFKGDNNSWLDPEKPTHSQLIGKALLHVPQGGLWLKRAASPGGLGLAAFALFATGGPAFTRTRRRRRKERNVSRHAAPPRTRLATGAPALPPALRSTAAVAAALGIAGSALGLVAWTRPVEHATAASTQATSRMQFSYTATVPQSPAYDGTTVTAPEPVFRRLTDNVTLRLRFTGASPGGHGTVSVAAKLATSSGWRSTVPLSGRETFDGGRYDGRVSLDLSALQRRADAAGKATGIPAGAVSVTIAPTVSTPGTTQPFEPTLSFQLDPTALRLTDGDGAKLTIKESTPVTSTRQAASRLTFTGRSMTGALARKVSAAAVGLAAVIAGLLALIARRSQPLAESERIRRQHGQLLLSVQPVAAAPGRPVVDVSEFPMLVRLAERYGLLVLHWSRSGVDTYIVQDEGVTYRYSTRAPQGESSATVSAGV
ncbi:MAG: hypothetical protein QOI54_2846 [Actinomycetota bacterium]|nr:hypothetical protein [Actinomycetota bacterium]